MRGRQHVYKVMARSLGALDAGEDRRGAPAGESVISSSPPTPGRALPL